MSKAITSEDNFFQPAISTLGLLSSIIATILPLFPIQKIQSLFIREEFISITTTVTFLLGFIIIWLLIDSQSYINWSVYKWFKKENGLWFYLTTSKLVIFFVIVNIFLACYFLWLSNQESYIASIVQSFVYIIFFLLLLSSFSLVYSHSKGMHRYASEKYNFSKNLFDLLERSGHLSNSLEVLERTDLRPADLAQRGIVGFYPLAKKVMIKTTNQPTKELECIVSADLKEIIKITTISSSK